MNNTDTHRGKEKENGRGTWTPTQQGKLLSVPRVKRGLDSHVDELLVEALPQVVQQGGLAGVGVQQDQVLDAHAVPGRQRALHVPQDPVAPLLQTLEQTRGGGQRSARPGDRTG